MQEKIIIILGTLIVIQIIIFIRVKYEFSCIEIKNYNIKTNKIKHIYEFLLISDIHCMKFGKANKKMIDLLNNYENIDLYIAGDLITCTRSGKIFVDNALELISDIRNKTSVNNIYMSLGNHELRMIDFAKSRYEYKIANDKFNDCIIKYKIDILDNNHKNLGDVCLYGLSLYKGYFRHAKNFKEKKETLKNDYINNCIGQIDKNKFNIIMSHNPDYSENPIDYGFDLVLSGHHHGGLIRLPMIGSIFSPELMLFPKYSKGLYHYNDKTIIVSAGLGGNSNINIRLNNKPDINHIKIIGV